MHDDSIYNYAAEFDLEFQPVDYTVPESAGPATVCVVQTSSPAVSFARDVSVSFTTTGNTATCECNPAIENKSAS